MEAGDVIKGNTADVGKVLTMRCMYGACLHFCTDKTYSAELSVALGRRRALTQLGDRSMLFVASARTYSHMVQMRKYFFRAFAGVT